MEGETPGEFGLILFPEVFGRGLVLRLKSNYARLCVSSLNMHGRNGEPWTFILIRNA